MVVVLVIFLNLIIAMVTTQAQLQFTVKSWFVNENMPPMLFTNREESLVISCQTNDPKAIVSLKRKVGQNDVFKELTEIFGDRVKKVDQRYEIASLNVVDAGIYKCFASNDNESIDLVLGNMMVSPVPKNVAPEIYPKTSEILIELDGNKNITCKTVGASGIKESFLNWYKEDDGGGKVLVDKSKVIRTETLTQSFVVVDVEKLTLKKFSVADTGKYICERKVRDNAPTSKSVLINIKADEATVVVIDSPKIRYESPDTSILISCKVTGIPSPLKQWEKDGKIVKSCYHNEDTCILYIKKVAYPKNNGNYTCVGKNRVNNVAESITVVVLIKPRIIKPSLLFVANYKDDRDLYCEFEMVNPLPAVQWQEQNDDCNPEDLTICQPLDNAWTNVTEQFPAANVPTNFSYIVSKQTKRSIFYRCIAKNIAGEDVYEFKLERKEFAIPQLALLPESDPFIINEGDRLLLECETNMFAFRWAKMYKNSLLLDFEDVSDPAIDAELRKIVYEKSSALLSHSGVYECIAGYPRGGFRTAKRKVVVKELLPPSIQNFTNLTVSQEVVRNMYLNCNISGNPKPDVTWSHKNQPLVSIGSLTTLEGCNQSIRGIYRQPGISHRLILCKLNYTVHQGLFQCEASNKVGRVKQAMIFTINAKPKILEWHRDRLLVHNEDARLRCAASGNPLVNITWQRIIEERGEDNKTIHLGSGVEVSVYEIKDVTLSDVGLYKCIASNKLANTTQYVRITVTEPPVTLISGLRKEALYSVIIASLVIIVLIIIAIYIYVKRIKRRYARYLAPNKDFIMDPDRSIFEQTSELPYDMSWEFPRDRLNFVKTLGSGAFGQVWLAEAVGINNFAPRDQTMAAVKRRKSMRKQVRRYHSFSVRYKKQHDNTKLLQEERMLVAVKTLKEDAAETEYKDLATELKILIHLGEHKNIVNLLGACTTKGEKLNVILEYCPGGNLLTMLRSKREIFNPAWFKAETDMENEFTYIDLVLIAYQVSKGMEFLQSKKCVHRDLAARNVLIGTDYVMKVADFGLARDIYKNEFYLKETTGLLPVKWMAPESLFDRMYTSSSDVWSFGILLWEVFTLGGSPYPGLPTEELFSFLQNEQRMDCPEICPKPIYNVMLDCWTKSPYDRPLFTQVAERLSNIMKSNVPNNAEYLDFSDGNPDDYLQPTENQLKPIQRADSSDYLVAERVSPKGHTYVPEPSQNLLNHEEELPPPPDSYVPMTPAGHYKYPPAFNYSQEARV